MLKNVFNNEWKPIYTKMMQTPGLTIPTRLEDIDEAFVRTSYVTATDYLKSCFSYIFEKDAGIVNAYTLGTWSFKIKHSEVKKHGNPADIGKLPPLLLHSSKQAAPFGKRRKVNKVA